MQATELDDLKAVWQTLNRNLERQYTLTVHQLREQRLTGLRSILRSLRIGKVFQLLCGLLLVAVSARFWMMHLGVVHLMVYGISLHIYGLLLIVFAAREFFLMQHLDYGVPVLDLQKQVVALRQWHLQAAVWFGVTSCFVWIPAILIVFYQLGGDVWRDSAPVVGWLIASGFLTLALLTGVVWFARRPGQRKFAKILEDQSVGSLLNRAQAMLEEVDRFERES